MYLVHLLIVISLGLAQSDPFKQHLLHFLKVLVLCRVGSKNNEKIDYDFYFYKSLVIDKNHWQDARMCEELANKNLRLV
jgi:hypothetical protein